MIKWGALCTCLSLSSICLAKVNKTFYTVRETDNDWVIAKRLGIKLSTLHELNPNINWNRMGPGKRIYIPSALSSSTAPRSSHIVSKVTPQHGHVKTRKDNVLVRSRPTSDAAKLTMVEQGASAKVLDRNRGWYKLRFKNNEIGWVREDMVELPTKSLVVTPKKSLYISSRRKAKSKTKIAHRIVKKPGSKPKYIASNTDAGSYGGSSVVRAAYRHLGTRYRWGGMSRHRGFDCSGLTSHVYKQHGVHLPHSSRAQAKAGKYVDKAHLRPGDLVIFRNTRGRGVGHVGIYTGNGEFIHASGGRRRSGRVKTSRLSEGWYARRYVCGRRITGGSLKSSHKKNKRKH